METTDKIDQIIKTQYKDYKGLKMAKLKELHQHLRQENGDEWFLKHIEAETKSNPRPVSLDYTVVTKGFSKPHYKAF